MGKEKKRRNAVQAYATEGQHWTKTAPAAGGQRAQIVRACPACRQAAIDFRRARIRYGFTGERPQGWNHPECPEHYQKNTKKGFGSAITRRRWKSEHIPQVHARGIRVRD